MLQANPENCAPKFLSPDFGLPSRIASYEVIAEELGIELVWWQREVLHRLTQFDPKTKRPIYREAVVTLPRQSGKSVLCSLLCLERMLLRNQPSLFAAQNVLEANSFWEKFPRQVIETSGFDIKYNLGFYKPAGYLVLRNERTRVEMRTIAANNRASGHGNTVPLIILDEAWAMNGVLEDGVRPAMRTFDDALLLSISTAGDSSSIHFKAKVDRGREAALKGKKGPLFMAEWAADEDADPDDPQTWLSCNPSLGWTVDEETLRHEHSVSSKFAWLRAGLNQWLGTASDPPVNPSDWIACEAPQSVELEGQVVLALHSPPGGKYWLAVAADEGERAALIDQRTNWDDLVKGVDKVLTERKGVVEVVIDPSSPLGGYESELKSVCESKNRQLRSLTMRDVDQACFSLEESAKRRTMVVERHPLFTEANKVAEKDWKKSGLWRIKQVDDSADVAALYALAFAITSARQFDSRQKPIVPSAVLGFGGDDDELDDEMQRLMAGEVIEEWD